MKLAATLQSPSQWRGIERRCAMKYCENCDREFDTKESKCPDCGFLLVDKEEEKTAETVATMTILNIL